MDLAPHSICPEKARLLASYARAIRLLTEAVSAVVDHTCSADFDVLWYAADRQQNEVDFARMALDEHMADHKC